MADLAQLLSAFCIRYWEGSNLKAHIGRQRLECDDRNKSCGCSHDEAEYPQPNGLQYFPPILLVEVLS